MTYDRPGWRSSPDAIIFPPADAPALCVPTFGREGLREGEAWCIRGEHVMVLADLVAGKPCPADRRPRS